MAPNLAFGSSFIEEKKDDDNDTAADESFLECASAVDRVRMTVDRFGSDSVVLLTSFGVQSGVMLSIGTCFQKCQCFTSYEEKSK